MPRRGAKKKKDAVAEAPAGPSSGSRRVLSLELQLLSSLLQFSNLREDQGSICRLLATSRAAAAVVAENCKGQLNIILSKNRGATEEHVAAQAAWLQRNGHLVRELACMCPYGHWDPSLMHLKTTLGTLLPTLASSTPLLTKLTGSLYVSSFRTAAGWSQMGNSLAALSSLQHLQLDVMRAEVGIGPRPIWAALQRMPALTHCELYVGGEGPHFMSISRAALNSLPASLQTLGLTLRLGLHDSGAEFFVGEAGLGEQLATSGGKGFDVDMSMGRPYPSTPQAPLDLGHLTALKVLKPYGGLTEQLAELAIRGGDVLPPNLTTLQLDADYRSLGGALTGALAAPTVDPILPLKNLQVLKISDSKASAAQLQQLAAALMPPAGSLKEVSLGYGGWKLAAAAAAGWSLLPLTRLNIYGTFDYASFESSFDDFEPEDHDEGLSEEDAAASLFTALPQLTSLTSLKITATLSMTTATAQQLAHAVSSLTQLKALRLSFGYEHPLPNKSAEEVRAVTALTGALAALPNLDDLQLGFALPGAAAAITAGACAQQLTSLKLKGLSAEDVAVLEASPAAAALCRA